MPRVSKKAVEAPVVEEQTEVSTAHVEPATVVAEAPAQPVPVVTSVSAPTVETTYDAKKNKHGVIFSVNDISTPTREFTPDDHGNSHADTAAEFYATNQSRITGVQYL